MYQYQFGSKTKQNKLKKEKASLLFPFIDLSLNRKHFVRSFTLECISRIQATPLNLLCYAHR